MRRCKPTLISSRNKRFKFLHGKCQLYALVLHKELGLPMVNFFLGTRTRRNYCHSAVMLWRNVFIDVRGRQTLSQMRAYWTFYGKGAPPLTVQVIGARSATKCLSRWSRHKGFVADLAEAHRIYRRHLNTHGSLRKTRVHYSARR